MAEFNITNANNLFKINYDKLSQNVYNSANVMLARVKKRFDFTGRQRFVAVPLGFQGGVGSGTLPTANFADYEDALITAKRVYARIEIDRESMKASSNDAGAFVRATKHVVQKGVESWMRNSSRILFGDGTGSLGVIDGAPVDNGGGNYDIVISAATFKEANWEENDYINIETGSTDLFEVETVVPSTRTITVQRITGTQIPVDTDECFMQGSENNDPLGLKGVLDAAAGTLYTVPVTRRWQATQIAAAGAGITTDDINQLCLEIQRKSGKVPNIIMTSFTQFRKILNLLEDQKQYNIEPRMPELKGKVSFKGIEFMTSAGAVPIFPERFCEDDRLYALNDNFIECHHRPGFGWFNEDGTVLLRSATSDSYEARYGGYYQNYIVPTFHGVISGLAT